MRAYLIGAAIVLLAGMGIAWYGSSRYDTGYAQARTDMLAESQAATAAAQQEKDRAEANYRGAVIARENSERNAAASIDRLNRLLTQRTNNTSGSSSSSGTNGDGEARDVVLRECVREYEQMGRHAGRLADKVNGWIEYGQVLQRWGATTAP